MTFKQYASLITAVVCLIFPANIFAQSPALDSRLDDNTLRLNYIFSGNAKECKIALDELNSQRGWAGRRVNMNRAPLRGNGQICMTDAEKGDTLYMTAFSTLFQEWQAEEEASRVSRSFENVFLVPMPLVNVNINVKLFDFHDKVSCSYTHEVDPNDILIRPVSGIHGEYIHKAGSVEDCIDVAIVAEGYTAEEMHIFMDDARATVESILKHEPFGKYRDRFNFIAVPCISEDSGVSVPREDSWKKTAIGSHFDTFYSDRYLTTLRLRQLHDQLGGVPYEHIIILANTDTYGGGGIFNSYTLTTAHHSMFKPVVVHEFGHSFAGLADEYYYDDEYSHIYNSEVEPWEKNITTKVDFSRKWEKLMGKNKVSLYEGGGYQSKGVWRGFEDCRMKTNAYPEFCPVCQDAIDQIIRFYTED